MTSIGLTKTLKTLVILIFLTFIKACTFTQTSSIPPQFKITTEQLTTDIKELVNFEASELEGELLTTDGNKSAELTLTLINGFELSEDKELDILLANEVAKILDNSLSPKTKYDRIVIILLNEVRTHEGSKVSDIKELKITFETESLKQI